jgi:hypothetical protein
MEAKTSEAGRPSRARFGRRRSGSARSGARGGKATQVHCHRNPQVHCHRNPVTVIHQLLVMVLTLDQEIEPPVGMGLA